MWEADGFVLGKCLASDEHQRTYEATRRQDGREVVLKAASDALDPVTEAELSREFEALSAVAGPGIVQALALLTEEQTVLVLDRVPGQRLAGSLASGPLELPAFLEIAIQLGEALGRVHAARWIHCYVTPSSAVIAPASLEAVLIGFHLAQPLGAEARSAQKLAARGDLRYMAPEQTGRMNRGVDARSDLYALGATLYHALVGEPPFQTSDPLALIHAHMARVPPPPTERNPRVPVALSRIVLKLLEKQPESRYQSAAALVADLRLCRDALLQRGHIDDALALGATHAPDRPHFSSKLYDRERETELLRALFRQVRDGSPKVLVIAGQPGAGKSALIEVLRPDVAESGGYIAIGKFDLSRDRPYAAWVAAIDGLVRQFLAESDARLSLWRESLREALGNIAKVLVDLVPDLQFVVGEVPDVPRLGPRETQARLALALRRFLKACAAAELSESIRRAGLRYREPELCLRPYRMLSARECNERILRAELAASDSELAQYPGSAEPYVRTLWMMVLCAHGVWALALAQSEVLGERLYRTVPFRPRRRPCALPRPRGGRSRHHRRRRAASATPQDAPQ
jgi:hypothetical protein